MDKRIDITQKEPPKKEKNFKNDFKKFLFYFVQWTWGLPVNLVGGIVFLICTKILGRRYQKFGYAKVTYLPWKQGGLSLGLFIFMRDQHPNRKWTYNTMNTATPGSACCSVRFITLLLPSRQPSGAIFLRATEKSTMFHITSFTARAGQTPGDKNSPA